MLYAIQGQSWLVVDYSKLQISIYIKNEKVSELTAITNIWFNDSGQSQRLAAVEVDVKGKEEVRSRKEAKMRKRVY